MKRLFLSLLILSSVAALADQPGFVRTIKRPNREPQRLVDVTLRVQGDNNAVKTDANGEFQLLLPGINPGEPYALQMILKAGYELCETELKGRRLPYSEQVPLEILMVSRADLQADKAAIEAKARKNLEENYNQRLAELEEQLAEAKMTEDEYMARVEQLEQSMTSFDQLLSQMARRYAVTDYSSLDEATIQINEAIESGNLDEAERLIKAKGDVDKREAEINALAEKNAQEEEELKHRMEQLAQKKAEEQNKRRALADDYYSLFTIAVERFHNDTADLYICRRAELDTLNSEYQLQAGQFVMIFRADYDRALRYFQRAYRVAKAQNGPEYGDVATALSEIGEVYKYKGDYASALRYCQEAMTLREKIAGKESQPMAESYTNLAALYFHEQRYDEAIPLMQQALTLYEALCEEGDPKIANACNNLASNLLMLKRYKDAAPYIQRSYKLFRSCYGENDYHVGIALSNLGSLAFVGNNLEKSEEFFRRSVDILTRVLGKQHPRTRLSQENLDYVIRYRQEHQ